MKINSLIISLILMAGCTSAEDTETTKTPMDIENLETGTLAGGCFWCIEAAFEGLDGVYEATSGYTGGDEVNPTYEEVTSKSTGHYEAVQISYDPSIITYSEILDFYWKQIDPTDDEGQFVDRGPQYRTAIFYHDETQKAMAKESREALDSSGDLDGPVVTDILPATVFYPAEEYHQDYYKKRTVQYQVYKKGSGRESRLGELWDK